MADLYSVLPGIQVSSEEVLEAELIIVQVLQAKFPDMDLREGTGVRDLVIRPNATLMAMINKALNYYFIQNTVAGINDSTPTELVDNLMSNWFLERNVGSKAVINARLFFARQKDVVIPSDAYFSTDGTLKFFPSDIIFASSSQLTFDAFNNEYYYDLDLSAEQEGEDYNISSGSLLYFSNFDPYFLRAEINYLKNTAITSETNLEFLARAESAVSTRNLINRPSITAKMLADFPLLEGVTTIGYGDAEMIRDRVWSYVPSLTPPKVLVHHGGKMDIYCRVPLATGIVQLTSDDNGKIQLGGAVYSFKRSSISGSAVADTIPYLVTTNVSSLTSSSTTATCTTATAHGYSTGDLITIAGATPSGYNGEKSITVTGADTFTYTVTAGLTTPATGTITAGKQPTYDTRNYYSSIQTLTSLTSSGTTATATLDGHGLVEGRYVTIAGATPAEFNGTFLITGTTESTFTYTVETGLSSPATGTITAVGTVFDTDYGFSDRQIYEINFGGSYTNQTASFEISYFQDIDGLQDYLEDPVNRVLCADPLARGYNLCLLSMTITGYNGPAPDEELCNQVATEYLSDLEPGEMFVMADFVSKLNAAGVTTIRTPPTVTYKRYHRDLLPAPITGTITDYFDPQDRTSIFMLETLTTDSVSL